MNLLYLAKEPDQGVMDDLEQFKDYDITICACLPGYVDYYELLGYNVIDYRVLFECVTMKFDAVIGNPPYQDPKNPARNNKLWHNFVLQSLKLVKDGGHIQLVTPSSIIGETGFGKKMIKLLSSDYNLVSIDYTTSKHFPTVGVDICWWHVINENYRGQTKVTKSSGVSYHDLRDGMPRSGEELIIQSILDKVSTSSHPRMQLRMGQAIANHDYCDDGRYEIYSSGNNIKRTNIIPTTSDRLKFIVPFSCSYKGRFISDGYVGMLNVYCEIKDQTEGDHLYQHFDQPIIRFFVEHYKRTSGFTPAIKNGMIPLMTHFDDIQSQFNLTDVEMEYLTNNA